MPQENNILRSKENDLKYYKRLDNTVTKNISKFNNDVKNVKRNMEPLINRLNEDEYLRIFGQRAKQVIDSIYDIGDHSNVLLSEIYGAKSDKLKAEEHISAIKKSNLQDHIKADIVEGYTNKIKLDNKIIEQCTTELSRFKLFLKSFKYDLDANNGANIPPDLIDFIKLYASIELENINIMEKNRNIDFEIKKDSYRALRLESANSLLDATSSTQRNKNYTNMNTLFHAGAEVFNSNSRNCKDLKDMQNDLQEQNNQMKSILDKIDLDKDDGPQKKEYMEDIKKLQELKWTYFYSYKHKMLEVHKHQAYNTIIKSDKTWIENASKYKDSKSIDTHRKKTRWNMSNFFGACIPCKKVK